MPDRLDVYSIHISISVCFFFFALQAYIFDTIKNVFVRHIVNCNIVSSFSLFYQVRYHTMHSIIFMKASTFLSAHQYCNLLHIPVCYFAIVSANLWQKAAVGFPRSLSMNSVYHSCRVRLNVWCFLAYFRTTVAFHFVPSNPSFLTSFRSLSSGTFTFPGSHH